MNNFMRTLVLTGCILGYYIFLQSAIQQIENDNVVVGILLITTPTLFLIIAWIVSLFLGGRDE